MKFITNSPDMISVINIRATTAPRIRNRKISRATTNARIDTYSNTKGGIALVVSQNLQTIITQTNAETKIYTYAIPDYKGLTKVEKRTLLLPLVEVIREFYKCPENIAKFEKWKIEYLQQNPELWGFVLYQLFIVHPILILKLSAPHNYGGRLCVRLRHN